MPFLIKECRCNLTKPSKQDVQRIDQLHYRGIHQWHEGKEPQGGAAYREPEGDLQSSSEVKNDV